MLKKKNHTGSINNQHQLLNSNSSKEITSLGFSLKEQKINDENINANNDEIMKKNI